VSCSTSSTATEHFVDAILRPFDLPTLRFYWQVRDAEHLGERLGTPYPLQTQRQELLVIGVLERLGQCCLLPLSLCGLFLLQKIPRRRVKCDTGCSPGMSHCFFAGFPSLFSPQCIHDVAPGSQA
jgi:hypothetical protein